eukprot:2022466-Karenia_brevis.AAC.1
MQTAYGEVAGWGSSQSPRRYTAFHSKVEHLRPRDGQAISRQSGSSHSGSSIGWCPDCPA